MSTKVTDLTPLGATPDDTDVLHIIDVGDNTGGAAGTSKQIQVSNLLASAGAVDSVNGQTGTVVLDIDDINDVIAPSPTNLDVLRYNSGNSKWIPDNRLTTLYTEFRNGTSVNIYSDGVTATKGRVELTATGAVLKTGVTGIEITETSPGDIDLIVATDGSGGTAYTALNIDGSTTANEADINVYGKFYIHDAPNSTKAYIRLNSASNVNLSLPTASGTLARTADIATDAAVAANTAKVGITTQQASDITANNAKTGITSGQASEITANTAKNSYPSLDATKLAGIAVGAEVNTVDDVSGGTGLTANPTTGNVVINLDNTSVTAGSYTKADITVDAQGRITNASDGSTSTGTVTSVGMTVPSAFALTGSPITTSGTLALTVGGAATDYIDGTGALQTLPQATVTGVTGTAPISVTSGTSKTVSITAATASAAGSLSASDKTYLNNIIAPFDDSGLNNPKNTIFENTNGLSTSAGEIISILQDTVATNTSTNSKDFLGVMTSVSDRAVINGVVEVPTITGATVGRPLYLGTSGTFTATAPTTPSGVYVRVLGHFLGTTSGGSLVYFNPSNDWIERT